MDWFKIGGKVRQGCILSLCLFNLYAKYIMRNAGLEEAQAGIKIARRNINHLRYADDTTLMAESEEELESLLMKVQEESEKVGLKLNIHETKTMTSGSITSWEMQGWRKHKLESRLLGEISITSDIQLIPPYGRKWRTKVPLDESERGEWKGWLKAQHSEN